VRADERNPDVAYFSPPPPFLSLSLPLTAAAVASFSFSPFLSKISEDLALLIYQGPLIGGSDYTLLGARVAYEFLLLFRKLPVKFRGASWPRGYGKLRSGLNH